MRIVHLGLGSFFRAHQAWYTDWAPDADAWGVAAFAGRSRDLADTLEEQGGAYTLVTRAADGDRFDVVGSVVRAHAAGDHEAWLGYLADPRVAVLTLTVTEAGYRRGGDGGLDL
ncbi:MAG: mannitol dehydrogenase family protein, partial [Actinomycetes bacterium]